MEKQELTPEQEFQILLLVPNFRNQLLGVEYLINRFNLTTYLMFILCLFSMEG